MILVLGSLVSFSQNQSVDYVIGYDATYVLYTGTSSDVLYTTDSTWSYTINKKTDEEVIGYYRVDLKKVSGTAKPVNVFFQKKIFEADSYTDIDTVVYAGTADTTIHFNTSSNAAGDFWRVYIQKNNNDFKVEIEAFKAKFYK